MGAHKEWNNAHAEATRMANVTGLDIGIERSGREWITRYLPKPENRYGADARCEVVRPSKTVRHEYSAVLP